ncbi:uncharacterized protein G6M90_00g078460 [Metarhizium brunneum]|uniref:Protein kinase domain-containing protein n=1 Tax=Metarhizium brunneum TaxID=500148 RepID=A0A7D5UZY8_9HYPO|nr:hypothetical protein G6M90_00g078460 [Metarhizium brunneum]
MEDVRLVDWGESFPTSETATATHLAQPCDLKSPEAFFVGSIDYRHDLWRVGCMIYTLFHQSSPFGFSSCDAKDIQKQTQVIGPLPPKWHTLWLKLIEESPEDEPLHKFFLAVAYITVTLAIISHAEKTYESDDDEYHVKDDYEALTCLLSVMEGLMQHDLEKCSSAQEAAAKIQWHDYRRDLGTDVSEEDVTESEEDQESDS